MKKKAAMARVKDRMKYLVILKRFEIWLLLAVVGFVFYSAFRPEEDPEGGISGSGDEPGQKEVVVVDNVSSTDEGRAKQGDSDESTAEVPDFRVDSVNVNGGAGDGRIVEITVLVRSKNGEEVAFDESTVRAETESGVVVPHFFSPFQAAQVVDPQEPSLVKARFWLEQPAEKIRLYFQGEHSDADLGAGQTGT